MKTKIAAAAGGMALAVAVIGTFEGISLNAYSDKFAGGVPTVCYGETRGVKMGDKHTKEECDRMLAKAIVEFENGLDRCLATPTPLPVKTKVALVSWTYNVGTGAACKSTLVTLMNEGKYEAACHQLPRWNRAMGKVVNGLTNRRNKERDLCLEGLRGVPAAVPTQPIIPPAILPRKC